MTASGIIFTAFFFTASVLIGISYVSQGASDRWIISLFKRSKKLKKKATRSFSFAFKIFGFTFSISRQNQPYRNSHKEPQGLLSSSESNRHSVVRTWNFRH